MTARLYAPGTPFWEDAASLRGHGSEVYAFFLGGEEAGLEQLIDPACGFGRLADPAGQLEAPLRRMALVGQLAGDRGFWPAQAALVTIFALLGAAIPQPDGHFVLRPPGQQDESSQGLSQLVNDFFQAHLVEAITMARVARHLGVSISSLAHRYAAETGRPPMAALAALRIEQAKSYLLRGLKAEAVARETGFCDVSHFSRVFKRHCGLSPGRFRREFLSSTASKQPNPT